VADCPICRCLDPAALFAHEEPAMSYRVGNFTHAVSRWDSDQDYADEAGGPYPRRVERTCFQCGELFLMVVDGEYVMHPVCPRCEVTQDAERTVIDHAEQAIHGSLLDLKRAVSNAATPAEAHDLHRRITTLTEYAVRLEKLALDRADALVKGAA
jgi:hypothetical protein